MDRRLFTGLFLVLLAILTSKAAAQEDRASRPYYVVQQGDSLWGIAARFGARITDLQLANGITDPAQLATNTELIIPGLEGYTGRVDTAVVPYGETLTSLSRRFRVPAETLVKLNRLASPGALYAGATLIIPYEFGENSSGMRKSLAPGQSFLELAVSQKLNPWVLLFNTTFKACGAACQETYSACQARAMRPLVLYLKRFPSYQSIHCC